MTRNFIFFTLLFLSVLVHAQSEKLTETLTEVAENLASDDTSPEALKLLPIGCTNSPMIL